LLRADTGAFSLHFRHSFFASWILVFGVLSFCFGRNFFFCFGLWLVFLSGLRCLRGKLGGPFLAHVFFVQSCPVPYLFASYT